jgi:hypothetical protein
MASAASAAGMCLELDEKMDELSSKVKFLDEDLTALKTTNADLQWTVAKLKAVLHTKDSLPSLWEGEAALDEQKQVVLGKPCRNWSRTEADS